MTPGGPSSTTASSSFELSGVAVGDDGRPIANAPLHVNFLTPNGGNSPGLAGRTDEAGRYQVQFDAKRGAYSRGSTAMVWVKGDGYEIEYGWFRPTTSDSHQTLDLRPRLIRQMTAGEEVSVTVAPDDTPCINNVQDISSVETVLHLSGGANSCACRWDPHPSRPCLQAPVRRVRLSRSRAFLSRIVAFR
jgi:hypothetical protein